MAKSNLPIEVHDHFRRANELHKYVTRNLTEATKHALETGQELLEAKTAIPHGSWESECGRLFDGSLRTAQFYMQFAKHMNALPKAQHSRILFLEETLEGAAKVAKRLAKGDTPYPVTIDAVTDSSGVETPSEPLDCVDSDAAPVSNSGQHTARSEPETQETPASYDQPLSPDSLDEAPGAGNSAPSTGAGGGDEFVTKPDRPKQPPKQFDRSAWLKQWDQAIGPIVRLVDKIANSIGEAQCESHQTVQDHLNLASEEMEEWLK